MSSSNTTNTMFPIDSKQTTGFRWTSSYSSVLNNGQQFAVSHIITDKKLNMRWKILIIPSLDGTVQKDPRIQPKKLTYKENDYVSLYLISVDSQHDRTVKCDFTFDLEGGRSSVPVSRKSSSFEFSGAHQYSGWKYFIPIKTFIQDYIDDSGDFKISVSVDVVVGDTSGKQSYMVSIIDKLNQLIAVKERTYISLVQSFYLIPSLRRCYLELPTGKGVKQTVAFELQRIFYSLSKGLATNNHRFSQAIQYFTYFHNVGTQDFGKIISETLKQAIESSYEEGEAKLNYYFIDEKENAVNVINVDSKSPTENLIEYLKLHSLQIRELDIFPPILFINLPKSKSKQKDGSNQQRLEVINFPEDFYIDQICQDTDEIDERSNESHYVLYSVWAHEHSVDNSKGHYFTFTRPLNQPHWIKIEQETVQEVTFDHLLQLTSGPGDNRLPIKFTSQTELRNDISYAHMLIYILESEITSLFNDDDDKFTIKNDSIFEEDNDDDDESGTESNEIIQELSMPPLIDENSDEDDNDNDDEEYDSDDFGVYDYQENLLKTLRKDMKKKATINNINNNGNDDIANLYSNLSSKASEIFKQDQKVKKEPKETKETTQKKPTTSTSSTSSNAPTTSSTTNHTNNSTPKTSSNPSSPTLDHHHNSSSEIEKKMATLESNIVKLQDKYDKQMEECKRMMENDAELRTMNQKLKKDTEQLQKTIEKHQKAIDNLNKTNEATKKSYEETKKKSDNQKKELENMRKTAEQSNKQIDLLKKENATFKKQKEQYQRDIEMLKKKGGVDDEIKEEVINLRKALEGKDSLLKRMTGEKDVLLSLSQSELFEVNFKVSTALQSISEIMSQQTICVICMEYQRDTLFVPCGHHVTCNTCAFPLTTCPICRKIIDQKIKVISN